MMNVVVVGPELFETRAHERVPARHRKRERGM
jgi:hypothetical protein